MIVDIREYDEVVKEEIKFLIHMPSGLTIRNVKKKQRVS